MKRQWGLFKYFFILSELHMFHRQWMFIHSPLPPSNPPYFPQLRLPSSFKSSIHPHFVVVVINNLLSLLPLLTCVWVGSHPLGQEPHTKGASATAASTCQQLLSQEQWGLGTLQMRAPKQVRLYSRQGRKHTYQGLCVYARTHMFLPDSFIPLWLYLCMEPFRK